MLFSTFKTFIVFTINGLILFCFPNIVSVHCIIETVEIVKAIEIRLTDILIINWNSLPHRFCAWIRHRVGLKAYYRLKDLYIYIYIFIYLYIYIYIYIYLYIYIYTYRLKDLCNRPTICIRALQVFKKLYIAHTQR